MILPVRWDRELIIYMDINKPVRALYFPLNNEADKNNTDLYSYIIIDFVACKCGVFTDGSIDLALPVLKQFGIVSWHHTLRFDLEALYCVATVPPKLHNPDMDMFSSKNWCDSAI
jgi:hypothetical protein